MNALFHPPADFEAASAAALDDEALIVDLDGYEGPLDVLLALARRQKVDLLKLSVTRLAEQYLAFVRQARTRCFALAADYLVMAAWLAYLKSRLLLPRSGPAAGPEPDAGEVAARLAFRLAKLAAMRQAAEALKARPVLGRDVFARGDPHAVRIVSHRRLEGDLYALMSAYVGQKKRERDRCYRPTPAQSYPLDDARERLRDLLPDLARWTSLAAVAPQERACGPRRASLLASTLSASLEMVREGDLEARQLDHFTEIWLRASKAAA
ncbi:MAG: segregation/condensation protein A [Caulobacteraceae bacterium]|nr:segregation/condensation protein A [Caulobacteraceae bacterium]